MQQYRLTAKDRESFERDGFFFVRRLFDAEEAGLRQAEVRSEDFMETVKATPDDPWRNEKRAAEKS